ncbi:MAG: RnfABCDGE type electron transport complex subunit D [Oscillospiraceae bacterium]|nr:RnfABCDGE type electron transport complex subunit D [Oscillospiraceae bacterium]
MNVSKAPFLTSHDSARAPMADVLVALIPVLAMSIYFYGPRALTVTLVSVASCVGAEALFQLLVYRALTVTDLSAAVSGALLAFCLPVSIPYWAVVVGGVFAMVVVKGLFGGLGKNFLNPALAGRAFLCTFPALMSTWPAPLEALSLTMTPDAVTSATPLAALGQGMLPEQSLRTLFLGQRAGALGEASAFMLIICGVYLMLRRVISPRIPLCYLGTVAAIAFFTHPEGVDALTWTACHLLSGGLMLGALFMATDYVTTPVTKGGQTLFAVGCGALTMLIRMFGSYPEGVCYAILIMNTTVCLLDRVLPPRPFGLTGRPKASRKKEGTK